MQLVSNDNIHCITVHGPQFLQALMTTPHDRREDSILRGAIDRIRKDMTQLADSRVVYQRTLDELCVITSSPFGFIAEKDDSANGDSKLRIVATRNGSSGGSAPGFYDLPVTLNSEFKLLNSVIAEQRAQVIFDPEIDARDLEAIGFGSIYQLLAMPLIDKKDAYGVICIANCSIAYHTDIAKRCWPLLVTTSCVRRIVQQLEIEDEGSSEESWCETLLALEDHSPMAMVSINTNHKITRFNPAAERLFGLLSRLVINEEITELIPERYPNEHRLQTFTKKTIGGSKQTTFHLKALNADKQLLPIEVTVLPFNNAEQRGFLLLISDQTEIQSVKAEQEAQTQRFKAVSDLAPIGILQTNAQWEAQYVNNRWCEICGCSQDEVLDIGWINAIHHEDVNTTLTNLREDVVHGREFSTECRFQTPLGDPVRVELQARPLLDRHGEITGFIATLTDATYRYMTEQKLRNMAERDVLTGLANRALFYDRLEHALQRVHRHGALSLLCLDLDGFKTINDTLGHDAGDLLLVEVASRLLNCVRSEDTVARVGGDEFMVLIEGLRDSATAAEIAEKMLTSLHMPMTISDQEVFISTSIGITFAVGQQKSDAQTLIKQSDIALYRAKAEGRNNYQYYSPELEEASKDRLFLGNSLHRALERTEFEVFYQLQADVDSNQFVGSEALLRWRHPDRGLLPPDDFIPLLEDSGLIGPVSRWLWYQAFKEHKNWMDLKLLPEDSHISVNLSPRQLRDPQLLRSLESAMHDVGINEKNIVVEITESALLDDSPNTAGVLAGIKSLGLRIALDDFGTGYSSLTYLKQFSIDIIKIDKAFIQGILDDSDDAAITQAVLALAKSLNLQVVAEGVDSHEKLMQLAQWDCDVYQGYVINEPCASEDILSLLVPQQPVSVAQNKTFL